MVTGTVLPMVLGFVVAYAALSAGLAPAPPDATRPPNAAVPPPPSPPPAITLSPAVPAATDAPVPSPQAPSMGTPMAAKGADASGYGVSPLLALLHQPTDKLWEHLLVAMVRHRGLVVEVGSHDGAQAMQAYRAGHTVLALEPSPANHQRVFNHIFREITPPVDQRRISVQRVAASAKEGTIGFWTMKGGGTGDHVTLDGHVHEGETHNYKKHNSKLTEVRTAPLDVILEGKRVYILKVDVQGHEMHVFAGARRLFTENRVSFAMFEFQPKQLGPTAHTLIEELDEAGYDVFFTDRHGPNHPWFDTHLLSPTDSVNFTASFDPTFIRGFGEWTDLVAVCRRCIGDNVWPIDPLANTPVPTEASV